MSAATRFRADVAAIGRQFGTLGKRVRAKTFKPELKEFARRTLRDAAKDTPVRDLSIIREAQKRQYLARINCIPSSHGTPNPSLRVNDQGQHWLFSNGKWYLASEWHLRSEQWTAYQDLLSERDRRMQIGQGKFISERSRSRYLYRASWYQVADSLGIQLPKMPGIDRALTRRKPPKDPPRGYGQWRGGKDTLSIVVQNPFLEQASRYKTFSGKDILNRATAKNAPAFNRSLESKVDEIVDSIFR